MLKKSISLIATLVLALGLSAGAAPAFAASAAPAPTIDNDPNYWENLPGEDCVKYEPITTVPYTLPAPPSGQSWSKVIIKTGSGANANAVFTENLVAGATFQHPTKDSISHLILCTVPFDWNWQYIAPTCDALTVTYPHDLPAGQANDVNVKVTYGPGYSQSLTLNFHNNGGDWSGTQTFTFASHPDWPANIGPYNVVWIQVAGTNYHWTGEVSCGTPDVTPVAPVATAIDTCGEYGSIAFADTAEVDYTLSEGNGQTGHNVVTAVGIAPFVLVNYPAGGWEFELGEYKECVVAPSVSLDLGSCYPDGITEEFPKGTFSSKNVYFIFDNTASEVPVEFTVPGATPAIAVTVAAGATEKVETSPASNQGVVSYDVYAGGELLETLTVPEFDDCFTVGIPGDPIVAPQVCVEGELTSGSIWVDLNPGLIYSITGPDTNITEVLTATTELAPGEYVVSVKAAPGYVLDGEGEWPYTVEILAPEHCEQIETPVIPTVALTCGFGGALTSGSYTLPDTDGIIWSVNGTEQEAGVFEVPLVTTVTVTAAPATGYGFTPGSTTEWVLEFAAPLGCDLAIHPLVTPTAPTVKQPTCEAAGSYTLPAIEGIFWSVNGEHNVAPGTHSVSSATNLSIGAIADAPDYGIQEGATSDWEFELAAAPSKATCADLATLALTGSEGLPLLLSGAGALLLLGAAGMFMARRRTA